MKSIKNKLIKMADELDRRGLGDLASEIDEEILPEFNEKELDIEIPEDEFQNLQMVLDSLSESLTKKKVKLASAEDLDSIDEVETDLDEDQDKVSYKEILILVHPDCAIELKRKDAEDYLRKIKSISAGLYEKIFTNFIFSDNLASNPVWSSHPNMDIFLEIRSHLKNISDWAHDTKMGKERFNGIIGEFLLEHNNLVIMLGGGYQDLCLRDSYNNFCEILDWLVEENKHKVFIEKELIFYRPAGYDDKLHVGDWWDTIPKMESLYLDGQND